MGSRRRSREIALQILFQMEVIQVSPEEGLNLYYEMAERNEDREFNAPDSLRPFAELLVQGVFSHKTDIDQMIRSASEHWRLERMSFVDRNILRIALYEMLHCPDIPPKVSINEAVDLGKSYGSGDSSAFINGILDHVLTLLYGDKEILDSPRSSTSQEKKKE